MRQGDLYWVPLLKWVQSGVVVDPVEGDGGMEPGTLVTETWHTSNELPSTSLQVRVKIRAGNSLFDRRAMVEIKTAIDNRRFTVL